MRRSPLRDRRHLSALRCDHQEQNLRHNMGRGPRLGGDGQYRAVGLVGVCVRPGKVAAAAICGCNSRRFPPDEVATAAICCYQSRGFPDDRLSSPLRAPTSHRRPAEGDAEVHNRRGVAPAGRPRIPGRTRRRDRWPEDPGSSEGVSAQGGAGRGRRGVRPAIEPVAPRQRTTIGTSGPFLAGRPDHW